MPHHIMRESSSSKGPWQRGKFLEKRPNLKDKRHNAIIIAMVNGEFTVKRLYHKGNAVYLVPANARYRPIKITAQMQFQVWALSPFVFTG